MKVFQPMRLHLEGIEVFQGKIVPPDTGLGGYAALVYGLSIEAPVRKPVCISKKYVRGSLQQKDGWQIFDKRYFPGNLLTDHLVFALKHEWMDLLIVKSVFLAIQKKELEAFIQKTPTGNAQRKLWFLYEFLMGKPLDLDDATNVTAVDILDTKAYFTATPTISRRHRVKNNLFGGPDFCPIIRKTKVLQKFISKDLSGLAFKIIGQTGKHLLARASSFLLLADSKASFEIEGERPPKNRLERWGQAILSTGQKSLNQKEIYRLHSTLIGESKFTKLGYRTEGVFLGERDHQNDPLPEFIGARWVDLQAIMKGFFECHECLNSSDLDPVLHAALMAFGFVYIHPLVDGNGRMHRCLIHHVLAERKFSPPGVVFPVSSVMLDRIEDYRDTLRKHSQPLMNFIEWQPTPEKNIEVLNDTGDLYRFFDVTDNCEFLFTCVNRTVEKDLPNEIKFLKQNDRARFQIMDRYEMPDRLAQNLIYFIRNNEGKLPNRRRKKEFAKLEDGEVSEIEAIVNEAFEQ
jgi:hypothetical protein